MSDTTRIHVRLPRERREEIEALARELDTTSSELVRLGMIWVLNSRDTLLRGGEPPAGLTGAAA